MGALLFQEHFYRREGMMAIDGQTSVAKVIMQKGEAAAIIMDRFFCLENGCCPPSTLVLEAAAGLREKNADLPMLIERLNSLPDVK